MQKHGICKIVACISAVLFLLNGCDFSVFEHAAKNTSSTVHLQADAKSEGRWYFDKLDGTQRALYCTVRDKVEKMAEGMINLGKCDEADVTLACRAVMCDYPEYYWMPSNNVLYTNENNECKVAFKYKKGKVEADYYIEKSRKDSYEEKLEAVLKGFDKGIKAGMTDYDKELYIHDRLCKTATYVTDDDDDIIFTAYGALVNGRAVCSGYAKAVQLLCNRYGIPCHTVTGTSANPEGEYVGHMWNQICIGGRYYNLDVTWDDSAVLGCVHSYFNITDTTIKADHIFDKDYSLLTRSEKLGGPDGVSLPDYNLSLPACTATDYNYHVVNNALLTGHIEADTKVITARLADVVQGKTDKCELGLSDGFKKKFDETTFKDVYPLNKCALSAGLSEKNYINISVPGRSVIMFIGNN